jgi:hypothetical protein
MKSYFVAYSPTRKATLEHQLELRLGLGRFNDREQAAAPWLRGERP